MAHNKKFIWDDITWEIETNDFYEPKETYGSITRVHEQDTYDNSTTVLQKDSKIIPS